MQQSMSLQYEPSSEPQVPENLGLVQAAGTYLWDYIKPYP